MHAIAAALSNAPPVRAPIAASALLIHSAPSPPALARRATRAAFLRSRLVFACGRVRVPRSPGTALVRLSSPPPPPLGADAVASPILTPQRKLQTQ